MIFEVNSLISQTTLNLRIMFRKILPLILLISLPMFISDCARNPVTGKKEVMLMSEAKEQALGDQSDPGIVAAYGLYEDAQMQAFINEKGQQMAKVSHRPDLKYTFRILDSPVVNAFALPGGYVYFTRGIMAHFNNEAEFAGVLGHEIGHVTARHSAKQYTAQMLGQVGFIAGLVVSEKFRGLANEASQGLGLMFLKFGRNHETESDRLGVEYSTKINYDAHEMADFFQTLNRLQQKAGASIPDFLSTHPNPVDRYGKVHAEADKWQAEYPNNYKVNRDQYLKLIDGIVFGEDPKQGFAENNKFYHPELKFQFPYPNGWQLQNAPTMVQMAPQDGKALIQFTISSEKTLNAAANKLVQDAQLTVVDNRNIKVNGMNALAVLADQVPQQQQGQPQQQGQSAIRILSYFIEYGGYIYMFNGMALKEDYNRFSNAFKNTFAKFNKLTDPEKLNRKPWVIKVVKVQNGGPLNNVLKSYDVPADLIEDMAIVNGMQATDRVERGDMLKVLTKKMN